MPWTCMSSLGLSLPNFFRRSAIVVFGLHTSSRRVIGDSNRLRTGTPLALHTRISILRSEATVRVHNFPVPLFPRRRSSFAHARQVDPTAATGGPRRVQSPARLHEERVSNKSNDFPTSVGVHSGQARTARYARMVCCNAAAKVSAGLGAAPNILGTCLACEPEHRRLFPIPR